MVKMLGSNPFINTQGRYITNFIEIGLLVQKPPFGGGKVGGGESGGWSIFFGSNPFINTRGRYIPNFIEIGR